MAFSNSEYATVAEEIFGTVSTAMITPFTPNGELDLASTQAVADYLVGQGNDMLVVSGTTGESPTTTDAEKDAILRATIEAVAGRATVVAGVGTNVTEHSIELARSAERCGADGLLVVTPYYSKPPQDAIAAHMEQVASSTDLPVMLYDIPGRSGVPIHADTLRRLAEHPNILAVKDAKGDLASSLEMMASTSLVYYSGEDALNLPLLSTGAVGIVSVVGHAASRPLAQMVSAVHRGDIEAARTIAAGLVPVIDAVMNRMPGVLSAKAALEGRGIIPSRMTRMPLLPASDEQAEFVRTTLQESIGLL